MARPAVRGDGVSLQRTEITWIALDRARAGLDAARLQLGDDRYAQEKAALQDFLCGDFASGQCRHQQGKSIAPMRSSNTLAGGRCLKVRWATAGGGKSGGLRLAIVVYCDRRRVHVAGAWLRREDPTEDDFNSAFGAG